MSRTVNMANTATFLDKCLTFVHYFIFFIVFMFTISTFGNFQVFVSEQTLKYWDEDSTVIGCFIWDLGLICVFIGQHSLMATPWFKMHLHSWTRVSVSERLLYLFATCTSLLIMMTYWYSIPDVYLWYIDTGDRTFLWMFFFLCHIVGWLIIGLELLLMNTGELVGFTQVYNYHNGLDQPLLMNKMAKLREIYSRMRHPGAVVLTVLLWFHPLMTMDRVLLASVFTSYMIGRHSFDNPHYEFAYKHYTTEATSRKSRSFVKYERVKE